MAAAAAVAAAMHSRTVRDRADRLQGAPVTFEEWRPCGLRGPPASIFCTTIVSMAFMAVGLYFFVTANARTREESVQAFDQTVLVWEKERHHMLSTSTFRITAEVSDAPEVGTMAQQMESNEESDLELNDLEEGAGLLDYNAERFEADFLFPLHDNTLNDTTGDAAIDMGSRNASRVFFNIEATTSNGTTSNLTFSLLLTFAKALGRAHPSRHIRCPEADQGGVWRDRRCYVKKLLNSVCVQVDLNRRGEWQLHRRGESQRSFGCNPKTHWRPGDYSADSCWGPRLNTGCSPQTELHVNVTLRSAADPKLAAAELTGNSFNFGRSEESNAAMGWIFMGAGCLVLLPLCIGGVIACRSKKRRARARALEEQALSPAAKGFGRTAGAPGHEL